MVRKLDGFYYDKSKWKLGTKNNRYYLTQLSNTEAPHYIGLRRNIVAVTQVSEDSIIVLEKYDSYYLRFYSISKKGNIEEISAVSYKYSCSFWSDTMVFLDEITLYDLSKDEDVTNKYSSTMDYLYNNNFYIISLHQKGNHEYFYCTIEVSSSYGQNDFLQFLIDAETCKPAFPVYSTLRDSLIDLSDTFTLKNLIEEEEKYKEIVDEHMIEISMAAGEKVLLSAFDED